MSAQEDRITIIREDPQEITLELTQDGPQSVAIQEAGSVNVSVTDGTSTTAQEPGDTVVINDAGIPGPPGPPGTDGTDGADGTNGVSGGFYRHIQSSASTTWDIIHGLGYRPNVSAFDSFGQPMDGVVNHLDVNHLQDTFLAPTGGEADLS